MNDDLKQNLSKSSIWTRLLYMLLFVIFYSVAEVVITAVVIFQFVVVLVTDGPNTRLLSFGQSLSRYVYQVMRFLTFNSEQHPFPFGGWPEVKSPPEDNSFNAEESWTTGDDNKR